MSKRISIIIKTILVSLVIGLKASGQVTISGSSCGINGNTSYYSAVRTGGGNFSGVANMQWCVTNGIIVQAYINPGPATGNSTCQSGTNLFGITVQWTGTGPGTVSLSTAIGDAPMQSVTIVAPLAPGTISNTSQTIGYNSPPATINCSVATAGYCSPAYQYQWQQSPDDASWSDINGATAQNLTVSTPLILTTYYRRSVYETNTGITKYSNSAIVVVNAPFTNVVIAPGSNQDIFVDETATALSLTSTVTGGSCNGAYNYYWQTSSDGVSFADNGTTGNVPFTPPSTPGTSYYRLRVSCPPDNAFSNVVVVNVYQHLSSPAIIPSTLTISYNTAPSFTIGSATGGKCGGSYSYQWYSSTDNVTFTPIGSPGTIYLTQTTYFKRVTTCAGEVASSTILVNVNPQLFAGTIAPGNLLIPSGTSPGSLSCTPASGGACNEGFTYEWQSGTDGVNFPNTALSSSKTYTPGALTINTWYRVKITCGSDFAYTAPVLITVKTDAYVYNFVQTRTITKPLVTTEASAAALTALSDVHQSTQYFDGLGRPLQTVVKQGSLQTDPSDPFSSTGAADMVQQSVYDAYGREAFKYLGFASTATDATKNDGNYKTDAFNQLTNFYNDGYAANPLKGQGESYFFSKSDIDPSPVNRIDKVYSPGVSWMGASRGVATKYFANTAADGVRKWVVTVGAGGSFSEYSSPGIYDPGMLFKTITVDEKGNEVIEFKDREGKVILKKVQLTAMADNGEGKDHGGWLCTYYLYDDLNNLHCVIQPKGVELIQPSWTLTDATILAEQCFRYEYDGRNRMIVKKVPGTGEVYMVYDQRDRLVFTQDANLRLNNQWMTNLYDGTNRVVVTGITIFNGSRTDLQSAVTTQTTEPVDPTVGLQPDLFLTSGNTSGDYKALHSITMDDGFETADNTSFSAEIVTGAGNGGTSTPIQGATVSDNPLPSGAPFIALTVTTYDDYSQSSKTYNNTYVANLDAGINNLYPETVPSQPSAQVRGMVTQSKVRVLENTADLAAGPWLTTVNFYDDHSRVIQTQADNYKGGNDITSNRYDFSGKPLSSYLAHANPAAGNTTVKTNYEYNFAGRLIETWKTINDNTATKTRIVSNSYDALGQLSQKKLGETRDESGNYTSTPLESLDYAYNVRGWLLSINKSYLTTDNGGHYFAMELGYDKNGSLGTFTPQYNGNISGMLWKSAGDQQRRKYDFTYDAVNRLLSADFNQYSSGNGSAAVFDKSAGIDFSMGGDPMSGGGMKYDANGNILEMWQTGLKLNSSSIIDKLSYSYQSNSNKLQAVTDGANDNNSKLGDFKYDPATKTATDYSYDGNGNLVLDNNKKISSITYNHLNLPYLITTAKGTIKYVYDAGGNKLKKETSETGATVKNPSGTNVTTAITTTTTYLGGFIYESKTYSDASLTSLNYADKLQFLGHEEGRARPTATGNTFNYDYLIKDHLGNVRTVLTDEQQTDMYPAATMETTSATTEETIYQNISSTRFPISSITNYPTDNTTNPNQQVAKTKGDGNKIGPAILLKVMAGDKFIVKASSWYQIPTGTSPGQPADPLSDVVSALISGVPGISGGHVSSGDLTTTLLNPNVNDYLTFRNVGGDFTNKPKAYVNAILLDDQFKSVNTNSWFDQVGNSGELKPHYSDVIEITKNGYLYIYVSNETENIDVFFDNLQVTHIRGPLLEETHYYPFGLTMGGISSKALKNSYSENKFKYNRKELQSKEFSDESGMELYDFGARLQDPQVGRWWVVDPDAEKIFNFSTYTYATNNPISMVDRDGKYAVSVHYEITFKKLLELGYSKQRADLIAHYSSTYADHPTMNVQFADGLLHFKDGSGTAYRSGMGIDYSKTAESQNEKNSMWHSMMSDKEAEDGMTEGQAMARGLKFGWDNIFESDGGKDLGKLGQGLHALQDAIAHEGARTSDHLGFNWSSIKKFGKDLYGSTAEAEKLTKSALIVLDVINGKKDNLKSGDTLDLRGMSSNQFKQFLDGLLKLGFKGTVKNE